MPSRLRRKKTLSLSRRLRAFWRRLLACYRRLLALNRRIARVFVGYFKDSRHWPDLISFLLAALTAAMHTLPFLFLDRFAG